MADYNLERVNFLIIDDNKHMRTLVKGILIALGARGIVEASDGADVFKEMRHFAADIIICDWNMPRMSGLDLLKQVRMTMPEMPFLMVTARGTIDSVMAAKKSGVSGYVVKPFSPAELEQKVVALARRIDEN